MFCFIKKLKLIKVEIDKVVGCVCECGYRSYYQKII